MPLSIDEIIVDGGIAAGLIKKVQEGIAALPQPPEPVSAEAFGKLAASVLPELGALIDKVREDIAE